MDARSIDGDGCSNAHLEDWGEFGMGGSSLIRGEDDVADTAVLLRRRRPGRLLLTAR